MSSIDDTQDLIDEQIAGADDAPETNETPAEEAARLYAGKFQTDDALEQGYTELEKSHTQTRQQLAEYEAQIAQYESQQAEAQEQPFDPWQQIGTGLDEQTSAQLYQQIYQNPQGMMEWAQRPETVQQFGAQITDQVFATWQSLQPFQASMWLATHGAAQATAADRQALEELRSTTMADINGRIVQNAFETVKREMPDIGTYKDRVVELMNEFPLQDDDPRLQSAEALAAYVSQLSGIARWEEHTRQLAEAAPDATTSKPSAGARARTQTRSTAAGGSNVPADHQAFLDEVLAGQPGQ